MTKTMIPIFLPKSWFSNTLDNLGEQQIQLMIRSRKNVISHRIKNTTIEANGATVMREQKTLHNILPTGKGKVKSHAI